MVPDKLASQSYSEENVVGPVASVAPTWPWRTGEIIDLSVFRGEIRMSIATAPQSQISWNEAAAKALSKFAQHRPGWDGYAGQPLRPEAGYFAFQVLIDVMSDNTPHPILIPTSSGGVQIEWHTQGWDIEVDVEGAYDGDVWIYKASTDREIVFDLSTGDTARLAKILEEISTPSGRERSIANAG